MNWKTRLRPASFRGVRFFVDSTDSEAGRKIQLHEYPKRDIPYAEDMGKITRTYRFTAFVIGKDCFDQRDKLLEALEKEGAGELVHPFLGTLTVKVGECKFKHSRTEGGLVRFELLFYPGEDLSSPSMSVNYSQRIRTAGKTFVESAKERFLKAIDEVSISGVNVKALGSSLSQAFEVVGSELSDVADLVGDASGFAQMIVTNPGALANVMLDGIADAYGFTGSVTATFESFNSTLSSIDGISSCFKKTDTSSVGGDETIKVAVATSGLIQDALTLKAAGIASLAPVASAPLRLTKTASLEQQSQVSVTRDPVPVADDVMTSRDDLSENLWTFAETLDADHYTALTTLRQSVEMHLTEVAKSGVKLQKLQLSQPVPALVVAWRQFQDATRESEVCQRNDVVHPGFVSDPEIWIATK